jgi:outer membrane protein insertion porin family
LGGDVSFLRTRATAAKFWNVGGGFIFSASLEGGAIFSFQDGEEGVDPIRLTDRFTLGSPQIRGFDIRGVGPRVVRRDYAFDASGAPILDANGGFTFAEDDRRRRDEAVGGNFYYLGRLELQIPLGESFRQFGIRPSAFVDVGALFGVRRPNLLNVEPGSTPTRNQCQAADGTIIVLDPGAQCPAGANLIRQGVPAFREFFFGDTPQPRVSVGIGANWNSPFGPFRIDLAYPLLKAEGDDTRIFTFNVGTAF